MSDVYKQYRESEVLQADPVKLVSLMLDGAVRFARQARRAIDDGRVEDAHNYILRTYAVIAELMATLDFTQGKEIATQLEQVYDYALHLLKEANIHKDGAKLDEVIKVIEPLAATWREAFTAKPEGPANSGSEEAKPAASAADKKQASHLPLDVVG
jgi:flagellar secretion chaperone FliS